MPYGFGQLMLFKKNNYPIIPDNMKIFCGDDVIYYYHTLVLGIELMFIDGIKFPGNYSVSAKDWWDSKIAKEDIIGYLKWTSQNNLETTIQDIHKFTWKKEDYDYKIRNYRGACDGCNLPSHNHSNYK